MTDRWLREGGHGEPDHVPGDGQARLIQLHEAIERIRSHHDRSSGHVPTNTIGYCGESDGISATYCETGVLLMAIPADTQAAFTDGYRWGLWDSGIELDVDRLAGALQRGFLKGWAFNFDVLARQTATEYSRNCRRRSGDPRAEECGLPYGHKGQHDLRAMVEP